jgi:hypothetical protein
MFTIQGFMGDRVNVTPCPFQCQGQVIVGARPMVSSSHWWDSPYMPHQCILVAISVE